MVSVGIEIKGMNGVIKGMDKLKLSPSEQKNMLRELAMQQAVNIKERVLKKQTDISGKTLVQSARAKEQSGQTLVDKGHMIGAVRMIRLDDKKSVVGLGDATQNAKARGHQFGRRGLPVREWFGFGVGDIKILEKIMDKFNKFRADRFGK